MSNQAASLRKIQDSILTIRGQKVMIDRDLAEMYGVETKRLNEQVKRNLKRFPADFMFQLNSEEKEEVVAFATTSNLRFNSKNWVRQKLK